MRLERDLDELRKRLDAHLGEGGHVGQADANRDLRERISRLEVGVASTLIAVVVMLVKSFLPATGGG
jgi:hypothetical protein